MKRALEFLFDIFTNGVILYGGYLLFSYAIYSLSPVSWYFQYSSVEPVTVPIEIGANFILMESRLKVNTDGNMTWNDVLRCHQDNGLFTFFSNYDSNAEIVYKGDERLVQWYYRGKLPTQPSHCRLDSTITRELPFGISKQQTISSKVFEIK